MVASQDGHVEVVRARVDLQKEVYTNMYNLLVSHSLSLDFFIV